MSTSPTPGTVVRFNYSLAFTNLETPSKVNGMDAGRRVALAGTLIAVHLPSEDRASLALKMAHNELVSVSRSNGYEIGPPTVTITGENAAAGKVTVAASAVIVSTIAVEPA